MEVAVASGHGFLRLHNTTLFKRFAGALSTHCTTPKLHNTCAHARTAGGFPHSFPSGTAFNAFSGSHSTNLPKSSVKVGRAGMGMIMITVSWTEPLCSAVRMRGW